MPHGSWDKTAAKLRSWARALDEEGPAVPMEEPAEAERAFCTLPAARFGAALATYSAVQEREEARRLMYVALTRASRSLQLVMRVSAKPEDGYGDTWVTGDVFDALGWPMGEGASISMVDFGGRAPARVTAERLLVEMQDDEMGEGEGALAGEEKWRTEDPTGRGANGPTRGSSPKLRRRTFPLSFWFRCASTPEDPGARSAQLRARGALLLHVAFRRAPPQRRGGRRYRRGLSACRLGRSCGRLRIPRFN